MEQLINKLSEEEKKAIELQDSISILENTDLDINNIYSIDLRTYNLAVKTALNLIEKQQEQLQEKDKVIDIIAKYLVKNSDLDTDICSKRTTDCYADMYEDNACEECVIEYFTKKAREV